MGRGFQRIAGQFTGQIGAQDAAQPDRIDRQVPRVFEDFEPASGSTKTVQGDGENIVIVDGILDYNWVFNQ